MTSFGDIFGRKIDPNETNIFESEVDSNFSYSSSSRSSRESDNDDSITKVEGAICTSTNFERFDGVP